jgi:hypothetical protein
VLWRCPLWHCTLRLISDSRGPKLFEGAGADQGDGPVWKLQIPRKPGAGSSADERRPCPHQKQSVPVCEPHCLASVVNEPSQAPVHLQHPASEVGAWYVVVESPSHVQTPQGADWTCGKTSDVERRMNNVQPEKLLRAVFTVPFIRRL